MKNKKQIHKMECIILVLFIFCINYVIAEQCGDVNDDDIVNIVDALFIAQYYVDLNPGNFDELTADVNGDNMIGILDALHIAQFYVGIISSISCDQQNNEINGIMLDITTLDSTIINAESSIPFDTKRIIFDDVHLWRDFMPESPPDGKPLITLIRIKTDDESPFLEALQADRIYIINQNEVWISSFSTEERPEQPDYRIEKVARDGPKWGPHILVDVVIRLKDRNQNMFYMKKIDVYINRSD
jgi:hypothetical protein